MILEIFILILGGVLIYLARLFTIKYMAKNLDEIAKRSNHKKTKKESEKFNKFYEKYEKFYLIIYIILAIIGIFLSITHKFPKEGELIDYVPYLFMIAGLYLLIGIKLKFSTIRNDYRWAGWYAKYGEEKMNNFFYIAGIVLTILGILIIVF